MRKVGLIGLAFAAAIAIAACSGSSTSAPAATAAPGGGTSPVVVNIQNSTFPAATAKVDQEIEWKNLDTIAHTVTFDDGSRSGSVTPSNTFKSVISTAGTYTYHCDIHKSMKGTITITQ